MKKRAQKRFFETGETHELVGLLDYYHRVVVVPQPDGGVGARRAAAHHHDIAGDRLAAALGAGDSPCDKRGDEAGAAPQTATAHCRSAIAARFLVAGRGKWVAGEREGGVAGFHYARRGGRRL